MIGWVGEASFLDQSQREVQENVCNPRTLLSFDWDCARIKAGDKIPIGFSFAID